MIIFKTQISKPMKKINFIQEQKKRTDNCNQFFLFQFQ